MLRAILKSIFALEPFASFEPNASLAIVILLLMVPLLIALILFVYKFGGSPIRLPIGSILKRRAPQHLRPLRVANGAICPLCFRPMTYEPKGEDWHCEHCGVYYES